jgi:DNA-directed RNA polymerase specialized sigma24 family protein
LIEEWNVSFCLSQLSTRADQVEMKRKYLSRFFTGARITSEAPIQEGGANYERWRQLDTTPSMDEGEDDETLVLRIALDKCKPSLKLLIDRHAGKLTDDLTSRFKRSLKAPEVDWAVNVAFMNVWLRAEQFNSARGKFPSWLFEIGFNAALTILRGEKRNKAFVLSEDVPYNPDDVHDEEVDGEGVDIADKKDWRVRELRRFIEEDLKGNEQKIAYADLAADGRADEGRLADQLGTSRRSVISARYNYRLKFKKRIEQIEKNRALRKGRT